MKTLALAALTSLAPCFALAAPAMLPTRDVSVSYSLTSAGQAAQTLQLSYNAAQELARISSDAGYYVLANLPAGQAQLVIPALHAVVQAPDFSALTNELFKADDNAHFTPLGRSHYAGLSCENYEIKDQNGSAHACLTSDGVVLHFKGHNTQGDADVTALSVNYAAQPASNFELPAGLTPLTLPPDALKALLNAH